MNPNLGNFPFKATVNIQKFFDIYFVIFPVAILALPWSLSIITFCVPVLAFSMESHEPAGVKELLMARTRIIAVII